MANTFTGSGLFFSNSNSEVIILCRGQLESPPEFSLKIGTGGVRAVVLPNDSIYSLSLATYSSPSDSSRGPFNICCILWILAATKARGTCPVSPSRSILVSKSPLNKALWKILIVSFLVRAICYIFSNFPMFPHRRYSIERRSRLRVF